MLKPGSYMLVELAISMLILAMLMERVFSPLSGRVSIFLLYLTVFMILTPLIVVAVPSTTSQSVGPEISAVGKISSNLKQNFTITGSGFGSIPPQTVAVGDGSVNTYSCGVNTPYMAIYDLSIAPDSWEAGWQSCSNSDLIGVRLVSWNDSVIAIGGFGSRLGNASSPATWDIATGDLLAVAVWGPFGSGRVTVQLKAGSSTAASSPLLALSSVCVDGLSVQVNGSVKESTGVSFDWGDSLTTNGLFPEAHLYGGSGTFTLRITASNMTNGLSSYVSSNAVVAPGLVSGCIAVTLAATAGGTVSYTAPQSLAPAGLFGSIPQGGSALVYVASGVSLNMTAAPSPGFSFSNWSVAGGLRGVTSLSSLSIIVQANQAGNVEGVFSPNPDFSISTNPNALTIEAGSSGSSIVTVVSANRFQGTVTLTATMPSGDLSFSPSGATLASGGSATSTLTMSVKSSATPGTYSLQIAGTAGTIEHDTILRVTVTPQVVRTPSQPSIPAYLYAILAVVVAALVIVGTTLIYRTRRRPKTD